MKKRKIFDLVKNTIPIKRIKLDVSHTTDASLIGDPLPYYVPIEGENCEICNGDDQIENLLLCSNKLKNDSGNLVDCPKTSHTHCLSLQAVPTGDWFCSNCRIEMKDKLEEVLGVTSNSIIDQDKGTSDLYSEPEDFPPSVMDIDLIETVYSYEYRDGITYKSLDGAIARLKSYLMLENISPFSLTGYCDLEQKQFECHRILNTLSATCQPTQWRMEKESQDIDEVLHSYNQFEKLALVNHPEIVQAPKIFYLLKKNDGEKSFNFNVRLVNQESEDIKYFHNKTGNFCITLDYEGIENEIFEYIYKNLLLKDVLPSENKKLYTRKLVDGRIMYSIFSQDKKEENCLIINKAARSLEINLAVRNLVSKETCMESIKSLFELWVEGIDITYSSTITFWHQPDSIASIQLHLDLPHAIQSHSLGFKFSGHFSFGNRNFLEHMPDVIKIMDNCESCTIVFNLTWEDNKKVKKAGQVNLRKETVQGISTYFYELITEDILTTFEESDEFVISGNWRSIY
eukprot:TRINITY_DN9619_c0_g1_i1.p1 TRINITY_DN9619_c0_g1~~TRINITY_DN9619_c0_g1_i1.p1  ORF type:complete len:514 (-),score=104.87 TRINITY_DN9619_c0_g1_i1:87-1628(-)